MNTSEMVQMDAFKLYFMSVDAETEERTLIDSRPTFLAFGALLIAGVALFSIFKYSNRLLQIKLGAINSFLLLVLMVTMTYFIMKAEVMMLPQERGSYLIGFWLPLAGLVFNFLANRFIRKDENLVRSADRIR